MTSNLQVALDHALLAGDAYLSTRDPVNQFPIPAGWEKIDTEMDPSSGFEAATFSNGSDIIISYAGTYDQDTTGDIATDVLLGNGFMSDQLKLAARYYIKTAILNPDASISFTGHSLGGGLASLIAVFFNKIALTFDQAPFFAVVNVMTLDDGSAIDRGYNNAQDLLAYLQSEYSLTPSLPSLLEPLMSYSGDSLADRAINVADISIRGELLSSEPPFSYLSRIGIPSHFLEHASFNFTASSLHSQALLAAFLQSGGLESDPLPNTFRAVTYKLPDLVPMIFSNYLYNYPTDPPNPENFIERLVRHEFGNAPGITSSDQMLTRFNNDLWKIAQDGGLTLKHFTIIPTSDYLDNNGVPRLPPPLNIPIDVQSVGDTLIAFAMQKYYTETNWNASPVLFSDVTGGVQFDFNDVANTLNDAKGYNIYFKDYITNNFTSSEQASINSILPNLRDWYVQAGSNALNVTDTLNHGAFMLGGAGQDNLIGGYQADLLIGNDDSDTLTGGGGADTLIGGAGNDTYYVNAGDTIIDSDDLGKVIFDGDTLTGGTRKAGETDFHSDDGKYTYQWSGGDLVINGTVTVKDFNNNNLGIHLGEKITTIADHLYNGNNINAFAVDYSGNVYFKGGNSDNTIAKIAAGSHVIIYPIGPTHLAYGGGIAVDSIGNLFFANSGIGEIIPGDSRVVPILGFTHGVLDIYGNTWVTYNYTGIIGGSVFVPVSTLLAEGKVPDSMAIDGAGNFYAPAGTGYGNTTPITVIDDKSGATFPASIFTGYSQAGLAPTEGPYRAGQYFGGFSPLTLIPTLMGLSDARDVAVDDAGNLYVIDVDKYYDMSNFSTTVQYSIKEIAVGNPRPITLITAAPPAETYGAWTYSGLTVDGVGNVYATDDGNKSLIEIAAGSHTVTTLMSGLNMSFHDVAVDSSSNVYVSDSYNGENVIYKISSDSHLVTTFLLGTTASSAPVQLGVDGEGNIYFGDNSNHTINEIAANDALTATNLNTGETYTEDMPLNLKNIVISEVNSATVTATLTLSNPTAGSLTIASLGAVTLTYNPDTGMWMASGAIADVNTVLAGVAFYPAPNFNGDFTISTSITDGIALPITGSKIITGTAVNDAPSFIKGTDQTIIEDSGAQAVTGWATSISKGPSDESSQVLTFLTSNSSNALFAVQPAIDADGNLTYTPAANANGSATVTVILRDSGATANGGADTSTSQMFTITVNAVNDAPQLTGAAATLANGTENTDYTVTASNLLTGWSDVDGSALSIQNLTADHGTIIDNLDGTYAIVPEANYNGAVTLSYGVNDGTDITTTTLGFILSPANGAPELTGMAAILVDGTEDNTYPISAVALLQGFTDVDGDILNIENLSTTNGTLIPTSDGWDFIPTSDYNGLVTLSYDVTDGKGGSVDNIIRTFNLSPVNDTPQAGDDYGTVNEDSSITASFDDLMINDIDVDGISKKIISIDTTGTLGSVVIDTANRTVTYNADAVAFDLLATGDIAKDSFKYTLQGSSGKTSVATVFMSVVGIDDETSLSGTARSETLNGTPGDDRISGNDGNDILKGGDGNDWLAGGRGSDTLIGGLGKDIFSFSKGGGGDIISDFVNDIDKIQISADTGITSFDQLKIVGGTGPKGFVYTTFGLGDTQVVLNGVPSTALDATDFIFTA